MENMYTKVHSSKSSEHQRQRDDLKNFRKGKGTNAQCGWQEIRMAFDFSIAIKDDRRKWGNDLNLLMKTISSLEVYTS